MSTQNVPSGLVRERPSSRPFTVLDGMILVAASALGLTLGILCQQDLVAYLPTFLASGLSTATRTRFAGWAVSALVSATLGCLVLRSRRPRHRLWLLSRQPGAVACGVASLILVVQAASLPLALKTMGGTTSPFLVATWYWPEPVCAGVLASWAVLLFSRRWRVRADWVDRFGVLIGVCWVGLPPTLAVIEFV